MRVIVIITFVVMPIIVAAQTPYDNIVCNDSSFTVRAEGIVISTNNLNKAIEFYSAILGLEIIKKESKTVFLKSGDARQIIIRETGQRIKPNSGSQDDISFSLLVNNIDSVLEVLKKSKVKFLDEKKRTEGVGYSLHVIDNEANVFSLLQDTLSKRPPFSGIQLYNFGYYVGDMVKQAKLFCGTLGFLIRSKRYLPGDIPLGHRDKTFAFMLHLNREEFRPQHFEGTGYPGFHLLFSTDSLEKAKLALKQNGYEVNETGNSIIFRDAFGIPGEIMRQ